MSDTFHRIFISHQGKKSSFFLSRNKGSSSIYDVAARNIKRNPTAFDTFGSDSHVGVSRTGKHKICPYDGT